MKVHENKFANCCEVELVYYPVEVLPVVAVLQIFVNIMQYVNAIKLVQSILDTTFKYDFTVDFFLGFRIGLSFLGFLLISSTL